MVASAGLVLGLLAPSALAAEKPLTTPTQPAVAPITVPSGYPAPPTSPPADSPAARAMSPLAANDNFSAAQVITGASGSADGDNIGATSEEGEPRLPGIDDGGAYKSVWYSWTAPASGQVTFDLCTDILPSGELAYFDSKMGAYTGDQVYDLSNIASNDDSCGSSSSISFTATAGTAYAITIDGYGGASGYFHLEWDLTLPGRTISISDVSLAEGTSPDPTEFDFKVTLSSEPTGDVTVNWETANGSATSYDNDYDGASGTLTFSEGDISETVAVDVGADDVHEADETFSVLLSSADGATIEDASATGTIENDDIASDMTVYVSKFGGKIKVGGVLPYYVQVFNAAGGDTASATVTDVLPAHTTFAYAQPSQGSCTQEDPIVCSFGDIEGGSYAYAILYAYPDRTGEYSNTVTLESSLPDVNPDDNTDTAHTNVIANGAGCTMIGTLENDSITGTSGDDVICTYGGADVVYAGDGDDEVRSGSGNDVISGGDGIDRLLGAAGEDTFVGGSDPDYFDGSGGRDTISYTSDPSGVYVDLEAGYAVDGYAIPPLAGGAAAGAPDSDTFDSIGDATGSGYADTILGASDNNGLRGGGGDDTIKGFGARDSLDGGDGTDDLNGGGSNDTCTTGEVLHSCEF